MPVPVLASELKSIGLGAGLDAVGVAAAVPFTSTRHDLEERKEAGLSADMAFTYRNPARSTDPQRLLEGARSIVAGARSYRMPDEAAPTGASGRVARYAWIDHYDLLRTSLTAIVDHLEAQGWRARLAIDSNALVDREAAHRAGIGWYGKNANLLIPGFGSWFVLGSVVTDAPLDLDEPVADGCGPCRQCLDHCPTDAIVAPGVVDARRCLAWLVQARGVFPPTFREALGDRIYGCDDCQEVCPPNRASDRRTGVTVDVTTKPTGSERSRAGATGAVQDWVSLVELLEATDEEIVAAVGRWYIPDRDVDAVRRNALIALGNIGDPSHPDVERVLGQCLRADSPLVRAHAVWAAKRLGWVDTVGALADDDDPWVRAELDRPVDLRFDLA